jgi:SAM-dependent methyltransferase
MTRRGESPRSQAAGTQLFATTVPGLGRMLRQRLDAIDGIDVTGTGFDGHSDVVFFGAGRIGRTAALRSRLAEDVFAEIGRASRAGGASAVMVASKAWQPGAVQRALSVWADEARPLAASMTFRIIVRVLGETRLRRADLRRALAGLVARDKPRWRFADPAQLDILIVEFHDGQYAAGLRLGGSDSRPLDRRDEARPAALPPTVAAAMVDLCGAPGAAGTASGTLVDPCCGAGAILAQALAAGWTAEGSDIDDAAIEAAARAAPGASVQLGDARALLLPDDYAGACVSWLPFVRFPASGEFDASATREEWPAAALAEMSRITRRGGAVVLLAPDLQRRAVPSALRLRRQIPVRLPSGKESIWVYRRA